MKDYKLSEIKEICRDTSCEEYQFNVALKFNYSDSEVSDCSFMIRPYIWEIDKEQDPKDNPENWKEINDKLCQEK